MTTWIRNFRITCVAGAAGLLLAANALAQDGFGAGQGGWPQAQPMQQPQHWGQPQGGHPQQQPQQWGGQAGAQPGWGQPPDQSGQWGGAPGPASDPWAQPGQPAPGGWGQPSQGQGLAGIAAPQFMDRRQSQAGHVFFTRMPGTGARMQVGRLRDHMRGYFDGDIQIMAEQSDPGDQYAQIGFSAFKNGVMVMGMLVVSPGAPGEMAGALILDEFSSFQNSFPLMLQALQNG